MAQSPFAAWHDFYSVLGESAATLVGLMFVGASVGTGFYTQRRVVALRAFLSPTVVAFSVVLAISLIGILPVADPTVPGALLTVIGLLGLAYSWHVWRQMGAEGIVGRLDLDDRIGYLIVPPIGYLILSVAGAAAGFDLPAGCAVLAVAVCLLMLSGLRNAWDMTTWALLHRADDTRPADDGPAGE